MQDEAIVCKHCSRDMRDQRTFADLVGSGMPNEEIIEARRRFTDALTPALCEPVEICVAARALHNAHARAGWTGWQSHFEFLNFLPLESAAGASYAARTGASTLAVSAAVLEGVGAHHQFDPPGIEALVPFTAVNAEADAFARARFRRTSDWKQ